MTTREKTAWFESVRQHGRETNQPAFEETYRATEINWTRSMVSSV